MRRQRFSLHEPPSTRRLAKIPGSKLKVELDDVGCAGDTPDLLAKYTLGEESVSILGSGTAPLGDYYTVFQERAADISMVSAGEVNRVVNYAVLRTK